MILKTPVDGAEAIKAPIILISSRESAVAPQNARTAAILAIKPVISSMPYSCVKDIVITPFVSVVTLPLNTPFGLM